MSKNDQNEAKKPGQLVGMVCTLLPMVLRIQALITCVLYVVTRGESIDAIYYPLHHPTHRHYWVLMKPYDFDYVLRLEFVLMANG